MTAISEELSRLVALRDQGVLTNQEFDAQKARLLGTVPAKRRRSWPRYVALAGCAFAALFVLSVAIGAFASPSTQAVAPARVEPPRTKIRGATAEMLARAYEANEAAAQRDYGNQPLFVMGTVSGIDLNIVDDPVIRLKGTNRFLDVQANLTSAEAPKAADLHKGQSITLVCEGVSEVIGAPILAGCVVRSS